MEPGAMVRGVIEPPAAAAWLQSVVNIFSNNKDSSSFT
jgi:hypothetical protein